MVELYKSFSLLTEQSKSLFLTLQYSSLPSSESSSFVIVIIYTCKGATFSWKVVWSHPSIVAPIHSYSWGFQNSHGKRYNQYLYLYLYLYLFVYISFQLPFFLGCLFLPSFFSFAFFFYMISTSRSLPLNGRRFSSPCRRVVSWIAAAIVTPCPACLICRWPPIVFHMFGLFRTLVCQDSPFFGLVWSAERVSFFCFVLLIGETVLNNYTWNTRMINATSTYFLQCFQIPKTSSERIINKSSGGVMGYFLRHFYLVEAQDSTQHPRNNLIGFVTPTGPRYRNMVVARMEIHGNVVGTKFDKFR